MRNKSLGKGMVILLVAVMLLALGAANLSFGQARPGLESTDFSSANERVDVLIGFHETPDRKVVETHQGDIYREFSIVNVIAATMAPEAADALSRNPKVSYVELDGPVYAEDQDMPWGIDRVFGEEEYEFSTWDDSTGEGIGVAVLDTGIDDEHEDLPEPLDGINTIDDTYWGDDGSGHGTHVAGTIAALDNDIGVVGVAPDVDLYAVKVLDDGGSGTIESVVAGIEWAQKQGIPVMNMSLGTSDHYQTLQDACEAADDAGHLLVSSAGNSGNPPGRGDNVTYPARYDSVIAVAASDKDDERPRFSSTGPDVELIAPGVGVLSTVPGDKYEEKSGTSMASPHVAGTAALAWAVDSELTNVEIREILQETAEDLGLASNHQGEGLVRADEAVTAALEKEPLATGSIEGTVTDDEDGSAIEGATVEIKDTELSDTTDSEGRYSVEDVPEGEYEVTASADGYYSDTITDVVVNEDETTTVDFVLEPKAYYTLNANVNPEYSGVIEVDGGEVELPYEEDYYEGTEVTLEAIPEEGYEFSHWELNDAMYTEETETTITMDEDKDAVAYFEEVEEVTLTMEEPEGEGAVEPEVGEYEYPENTEVELKATPEDGWEFVEWMGDVEEPQSSETSIMMDEDKTVRGVFEEKEDEELAEPEIEEWTVSTRTTGPWYRAGVEWVVFHEDGALAEVKSELLVFDDEGEEDVVDTETTSVSGEEASGEHELRTREEEPEKVRLTVTDTEGRETTETKDIEF